ncbi:MAG: hypothetical protein HQM08_03885 [Candidatus Riflebacteria bacterium]|nr:hypothetical protein [Candidatus Riflebacteria bacterium]
MNRNQIFFITVFLAFLLNSEICSSLDLSKYQSFLKTEVASEPAKISESKKKNTSSKKDSKNLASERSEKSSEEADASYRDVRRPVLNEQKNKKDNLSLPSETRIPAGLRPILSERKNPKEGVSISGGTGAFLVPSPGVIEPGKTAVAVHAIPIDLYDVTDRKVGTDNYFNTSTKVLFGVSEGFELGLEKTFSNQDQFDITEPVFITTKYQVPGNITLGGCFATSPDAYSSVWVETGVPVLWVGVGANFGVNTYKFTYRGWERLARAKFGGYNYTYSTALGYADQVWFMVGGALPISNHLHFVYDFNGDRFSMGFRANYQKTVFFDLAYISDGDYERLPGAIAHERMGNFVFGGSIEY